MSNNTDDKWKHHLDKLDELISPDFLNKEQRNNIAQYFETYFGNYELQYKHLSSCLEECDEYRRRANKAESEVGKLRKQLDAKN